MKAEEFRAEVDGEMDRLFALAQEREALSFLFAVLSANPAETAAGFDPALEVERLIVDLIAILNSPIEEYTKIRLSLCLYTQLVDATYLHQRLLGLALAASGRGPGGFDLAGLQQAGVASTAQLKLREVAMKAEAAGLTGLSRLIELAFRQDLRDASVHMDCAFVSGNVLTRGRSSEVVETPFEEISALLQRALDFHAAFRRREEAARRAFPPGHRIVNRRSPDGQELADVEVVADQATGVASGFRKLDQRPLWGAAA